MPERILKSGTRLLFGEPAEPMAEIMADAISQVVAQVPEIREAYLPQCLIPGDKEARQVLVVGFARDSQILPAMQILMEKMRLVLPAGEAIDILPFTVRNMPSEARVKAFRIHKLDDPPWRKFWTKG